MSHLDTAYKLGALKAMEDFKVELSKQAAGFQPGQAPAPAPPKQPTLINPQVGAGVHNKPPVQQPIAAPAK